MKPVLMSSPAWVPSNIILCQWGIAVTPTHLQILKTSEKKKFKVCKIKSAENHQGMAIEKKYFKIININIVTWTFIVFRDFI